MTSEGAVEAQRRRAGWRAVLFAVALGLLAAVPGQAFAAGHIYLLRGFADVFSAGIDEMGARLARSGYRATVHSYTEASALADQAVREQKTGRGPIILIGHSFGAEAAVAMAEQMKAQGASVALIVSFGPTVGLAVPSNVAQAVNYYQGEVPFTRGPGFRGRLTNVNLDKKDGVNHFNIEKIDSIQRRVIARVRAIASPWRHRPMNASPSGRKIPPREAAASSGGSGSGEK
jgi:pimeloyl-ACP methyl ester carboxylesterase